MLRPRSRSSEATKISTPLPLEQNFAKTIDGADGKAQLGQTVFLHCLIVGVVCQTLIQRLTQTDAVTQNLPAQTPFLAALHDIGKLSPTFQEKIRRAIADYSPNSLLELKNVDPIFEQRWGGHSGVSALTLKAITGDDKLAWIVGTHHGRYPNLSLFTAQDEVFGGPQWQNLRQECFDRLLTYFPDATCEVKSWTQAQVMAGLTCVADWIGSGYPLCELTHLDQNEINRTLTDLGFVRPEYIAGLSFEEIFGFAPNEIQKEIMNRCTGPGVYVLEAPMGVGKTEAALFAAYRLLESARATGLYFALPTQATSEGVYARVKPFLEKILSTQGSSQQLRLLHSNACFLEKEVSSTGQWFASAKRGLLTPFGVGTIDQALLSVLNVRHGFVRTFGLLGKVVILDEVHSYDVYTGVILNQMVKQLRDLNCTVIILSATLTRQRRQELIEGNAFGQNYPLLSADAATGQTQAQEYAIAPAKEKVVHVSISHQDEAVLKIAVEKACRGEQVLWIENTVSAAQDIYRKISEDTHLKNASVECGILHSRFTLGERIERQKKWLGVYGKNAGGRRFDCGRILVGTQVLEQSLDIDADLLITRICPTDMALQRIGRLWRHTGTKRPDGALAQVYLLAPTLQDALTDPQKAFKQTGIVYSPYVLSRTLEVWQNREKIRLPTDIRNLLEQTYEERSETGSMLKLFKDLQEGDTFCNIRRKGLKQLRLLAQKAMSHDNLTDTDSEFATRYSSVPTVEVMLLKKFVAFEDRVEIEFLNSERLVLPNILESDKSIRQQRALEIMKQCLTVPIYMAPFCPPRQALSWLSPYRYVAQNDDERIRVGLVGDVVHEGQFVIEWLGCEPKSNSAVFVYGSMGYGKAQFK